jgi:hypothetical protein
LLLLLLLHVHLWSVLAATEATLHLRSLEGLQMSNLHGVQWLTEHLLLKQELRLGRLHLHLGLASVLEVAKSTNRLVDRSTTAVTRLEKERHWRFGSC